MLSTAVLATAVEKPTAAEPPMITVASYYFGNYHPGDESDPKVMAQKIDAAANHGIDAFIFCWYHYNDGPFLDGPIDKGFLGAPNNDRLKFAFMWANHDWIDLHPSPT